MILVLPFQRLRIIHWQSFFARTLVFCLSTSELLESKILFLMTGPWDRASNEGLAINWCWHWGLRECTTLHCWVDCEWFWCLGFFFQSGRTSTFQLNLETIHCSGYQLELNNLHLKLAVALLYFVPNWVDVYSVNISHTLLDVLFPNGWCIWRNERDGMKERSPTIT
jgi:hypothetical protein